MRDSRYGWPAPFLHTQLRKWRPYPAITQATRRIDNGYVQINSPQYGPALQRRKYVRKNLPGMWRQMLQTGNGNVVDPLLNFLQRFNQDPTLIPIYDEAAIWITTRVERDMRRGNQMYFPQTPSPRYPFGDATDCFEELRQQALDDIQNGVFPDQPLIIALEIYRAVGDMLRPDSFGCRGPMFKEFLRVGKEFAPLIVRFLGGWEMFELLEIVDLVAEQDEAPLADLLNNMGWDEKEAIKDVARQHQYPNFVLCDQIDVMELNGVI